MTNPYFDQATNTYIIPKDFDPAPNSKNKFFSVPESIGNVNIKCHADGIMSQLTIQDVTVGNVTVLNTSKRSPFTLRVESFKDHCKTGPIVGNDNILLFMGTRYQEKYNTSTGSIQLGNNSMVNAWSEVNIKGNITSGTKSTIEINQQSAVDGSITAQNESLVTISARSEVKKNIDLGDNATLVCIKSYLYGDIKAKTSINASLYDTKIHGTIVFDAKSTIHAHNCLFYGTMYFKSARHYLFSAGSQFHNNIVMGDNSQLFFNQNTMVYKPFYAGTYTRINLSNNSTMFSDIISRPEPKGIVDFAGFTILRMDDSSKYKGGTERLSKWSKIYKEDKLVFHNK